MISHLAQAFDDKTADIFYLDEMKFPLYQTPERCWTNRSQQQQRVYNRREVPDLQLTAIALCSTRGFEAVQIYPTEITGADFAYFIHNAFSRLPSNRSITVLADNASWHCSSVVKKTPAYKMLRFNVPHMFQLNLIETAFSFVRNDFRKRATVDTTEEEAKQIMSIFFDPKNEERFKGIYRNHLRSLLKYLELHKRGGPSF